MDNRYIDHSINMLWEYFISYSDNSSFGSINLTLLILPLLILVISVYYGNRIIQAKPNFKHFDPSEYDRRLVGVRGWLWVVLMILYFLLLITILNFYNGLFLFGSNTWDYLTSNAAKDPSAYWSISLVFTTASNFFLLMYALLLFILIFKKKRIFKITLLIFLPLTVALAGIKYFLFSQILPINHLIIYHSFMYFSFTLQISFVLLTYFAFSRRVNATFVN